MLPERLTLARQYRDDAASLLAADRLASAVQGHPQDLRRAGRGWRTTVKTQRLDVAKVLRDNPSLRAAVPGELTDAYAVSRVEAAAALEEDTVPTECPWTAAQVLDHGFFPAP